MNAEHTPTPYEMTHHTHLGGQPSKWAYVKHNYPDYPYEGDFDEEYGIYSTHEDEAGPVACVSGEANAEFIVRAVNNHNALVEALEKLVKFTGKIAPDEWLHSTMTEARAALKAAKGGK